MSLTPGDDTVRAPAILFRRIHLPGPFASAAHQRSTRAYEFGMVITVDVSLTHYERIVESRKGWCGGIVPRATPHRTPRPPPRIPTIHHLPPKVNVLRRDIASSYTRMPITDVSLIWSRGATEAGVSPLPLPLPLFRPLISTYRLDTYLCRR